MKKIKVIYIVSSGRSGSTLLERMLGQHSQIFACGELLNSWKRSFIENQLCSCYKNFYDCKIWSQVRQVFLSSLNNKFNPMVVQKAINSTSRLRHYFFKKNFNKNLYSNYLNEIYFKFYSAILESTDKDFIIDASKNPVFAHILSTNHKLDLYIIHLIRDPRGVAFSWTKKKIRPEIKNKKVYMRIYSPYRTAFSWKIVNKIAFDLKEKTNYIKINYEEFINNPKKTLINICSFLNIKNDFSDLFINEKTINLLENHTLSGNPIRFKTGKTTLTLDNEWENRLSTFTQSMIKLITLGQMKKSGYKKIKKNNI